MPTYTWTCPVMHTYLLTYLLTYSMKQSPSWEANRFSASQEIPPILWNQNFINAFISASHLSLSWASSIQSIPPHLTSWRCILILSSHPRLGLPSGLFLSRFPHRNPIYSSPLPHTCYVPLPTLSSLYDQAKNIGRGVQVIKLFILYFSPFPVTSSLLGPNILLNTIFSYTLSLRSYLCVGDQDSHPYKTTGKIRVLYILMFVHNLC